MNDSLIKEYRWKRHQAPMGPTPSSHERENIAPEAVT